MRNIAVPRTGPHTVLIPPRTTITMNSADRIQDISAGLMNCWVIAVRAPAKPAIVPDTMKATSLYLSTGMPTVVTRCSFWLAARNTIPKRLSTSLVVKISTAASTATHTK